MNDPARRIATAVVMLLGIHRTEGGTADLELERQLAIALRDWANDIVADVVIHIDMNRTAPRIGDAWACACGWMNPKFAPKCENPECDKDHP